MASTARAIDQHWCELCGATIGAACRVEYDGKPYHRMCDYRLHHNGEYLGKRACSPKCKCWPQGDPATCVHPHGFDAKGSCFKCDAKIGPSIIETASIGQCSAIVPSRWHTSEHWCGFRVIPGTDRCGTHKRTTRSGQRRNDGGGNG